MKNKTRQKIRIATIFLLCIALLFTGAGCSKSEREQKNDKSDFYADVTTADSAVNSENADITYKKGTLSNSEDTFTSFSEVIEHTKTETEYDSLSDEKKEYYRGNFFELNGRDALLMIYSSENESSDTTEFCTCLWTENDKGTISCLWDQVIFEIDENNTDLYRQSAEIRRVDGALYLSHSHRIITNSTDISKEQFYLIGDTLQLKYDFMTESECEFLDDIVIRKDGTEKYYFNQEIVDHSTYVSVFDDLHYNNLIIYLTPDWEGGMPPEGYVLDELTDYIPKEKTQTNTNTATTQKSNVKSETISKDELIGRWVIDAQYTMDYTDQSMTFLYGSMYNGLSDMSFDSDGTFSYGVAAYYGKGSYKIDNSKISIDLVESDSSEDHLTIFVMKDGITRLGLDQFNNGDLIFWKKV